MYVLSLLVTGRSFIMYMSWFFLNQIFCRSCLQSGGAWSAQQGRNFSMYSGGAQPFALDDKGGEDLGVAIKSKGGDCWHFGTGVALRYRCCPWWQLSLMTNLSPDYKNEENFHIRRFIKPKLRIHAGTLYTKSRIRRNQDSYIQSRVYTQFHEQKRAYMSRSFPLVRGS